MAWPNGSAGDCGLESHRDRLIVFDAPQVKAAEGAFVAVLFEPLDAFIFPDGEGCLFWHGGVIFPDCEGCLFWHGGPRALLVVREKP